MVASCASSRPEPRWPGRCSRSAVSWTHAGWSPAAAVGERPAHDQRVGAHRPQVDERAGESRAGDAVDLDDVGGVERVDVMGDGPVRWRQRCSRVTLTSTTATSANPSNPCRRGARPGARPRRGHRRSAWPPSAAGATVGDAGRHKDAGIALGGSSRGRARWPVGPGRRGSGRQPGVERTHRAERLRARQRRTRRRRTCRPPYAGGVAIEGPPPAPKCDLRRVTRRSRSARSRSVT